MPLPAKGERREGVKGWIPNGPLTITLGDSIIWQLLGVGEIAGHNEEEGLLTERALELENDLWQYVF